jgi:hypothetical protein
MKLLVCPGIPRCGTTYLFHQLAKHDGTTFNVPRTKETNYFGRSSRFDDKSFRSMYRSCNDERYYLDFSPAYLRTPHAIAGIAEFAKYHEVRAIINLRHPVDQAYAHYLHDIKAHISKRERMELNYPFFCIASLNRYLVKRAALVRSLVDAVGQDNVFTINFHTDLKDLDNLRLRLSNFLKTDQFSLAPERISPGGWMPYYVYGGAEGCDVTIGDAVRTLPANHLLLVNGPDSLIWDEISDAVAFDLLRAASTWTRQIEATQAQTIYDAVHHDFMEVLGTLSLDRDSFGSTRELIAEVPSVNGTVAKRLPFRIGLADRMTQFSTDLRRTIINKDSEAKVELE